MSPSMPEENKAVVRWFFAEVINARKTDRAGEFVTSDYVEHQQLPGAQGRQGIVNATAFLAMMRGAFPDYQFTVEDLVAEGDKVVARVTVNGTHRGELMGLAPTGKRVRTSGDRGVLPGGRQAGRALGHIRHAQYAAADRHGAGAQSATAGAPAGPPATEAARLSTSHRVMAHAHPCRERRWRRDLPGHIRWNFLGSVSVRLM